jgi:truncated hemoglobin YjbI
MDNLFDKYGGIDVMRELIKEFYAQVYARPALKPTSSVLNLTT